MGDLIEKKDHENSQILEQAAQRDGVITILRGFQDLEWTESWAAFSEFTANSALSWRWDCMTSWGLFQPKLFHYSKLRLDL